jgi:hypothetical protein
MPEKTPKAKKAKNAQKAAKNAKPIVSNNIPKVEKPTTKKK